MDLVAEGSAPPWTKLYGANVPACLEPVCDDMATMFSNAVRTHPDGVALIYFDQSTSYAELDALSDSFACYLLANGVGRGDRVQIVAQNIPAFPIACLAAWKIGAVPVPTNPMYRSAELVQIFKDSEPSAILCQDVDATQTAKAMQACKFEVPLIVVSPFDGQSRNDARVLPRGDSCENGVPFSEVLARYFGARTSPVPLSRDDLGLILYTSGTTGTPKGAMLTHGNLTFNADFLRTWADLGQGDVILAIAPFFHITGLECHICTAFSAACAMVLTYRFEPRVVLDAIRCSRPTFTIGAITAFNALATLPEADAQSMSSLTKVFSGGAPIPPALRLNVQDRLGCIIHPCYGMTETTAPAVFSPLGVEVPQFQQVLSIGIPICSTEIRFIDDYGNDLPIGIPGELLLRGPEVMLGYWRKPTETAETLKDGWIHTGDVGFRDEQGWIYLVDRKKDVIIASGYKVWPREVEDVLYEHPAVREAAVIGVTDAYRGEDVKACISLATGAEVEAEEIVTWCRERLAAYKVPRVIQILDDLPKTISGKIQRVTLRNT